MYLHNLDRPLGNIIDTTHGESYLIGWPVRGKSALGFTASYHDESLENTNLLYSDGWGHSVTAAATGSGKTVGLISRLLCCPHNAVVIDVKGEIYHTTQRYRRDHMGHDIVVWDPTGSISGKVKHDSFNPLDVFDIVRGDLEDFVGDILSIVFDPANRSQKEPYWDSVSEIYSRGLLLDLMIRAPRNNRNLVELWHRVFSDMYGSAKIADEAAEQAKAKPRKNERLNKAVKLIATTLDLPELTRGGVKSTAQHHFNFLTSERVATSVRKTTFDLKRIYQGQPFTLYLVVPPHALLKLAPLLRLMLHVLTLLLMKRANPLRSPVRLIVDEAGVIGKLDILQTTIALGRGYGLFVDMIFQDISQLQETYVTGWKNLLGNCRYQHYFGFNSFEDAEIIGRRTGFSPDYLMQVNQNRDLMLFVENGVGTITRKANYLRDPMFSGRFDPNPLYL